jgi:hypothetical protein
MISLLAKSSVVGVVENDLSDAIAVAQVDEGHASHLSDSLHPAGEGNGFSCICEAKLAASIGPVHDIIVRYVKLLANIWLQGNNVVDVTTNYKVTQKIAKHQPVLQ